MFQKVLVITGPGGSGKSTLARGVAETIGWTLFSEDEYWIENGWGHGLRTEEQERVVQQQVLADLLAVSQDTRGAVLEFILYKRPPNPLTAYHEGLSQNGTPFETIVLRPDVEQILRRIKGRARPSDLGQLEQRRLDSESQVEVIRTSDIDPSWVLDTTKMSAQAVLDHVLSRLHDV